MSENLHSYISICIRQASQLSLALVRACVAPVCNFKSEVEVVPIMEDLSLVGEM